MTETRIRKSAPTDTLPVMPDYQSYYERFRWDDAWEMLDGLPDGGLNIAHECVVRHARGPRAGQTALRWIGAGDDRRELTYSELSELSDRFGAALRNLGVTKGSSLFSLCGRVPPLYIAALGTLKIGAVFCPLFAAFGPEPIRQRLQGGSGKVLLTTARIYREKVAGLRDDLPHLEHVVIVDALGEDLPEGTLAFEDLLKGNGKEFVIEPTGREDRALLHFTSGTTGKPKGVMHVHGAVVAHHITGKIALDFHDDDIFWCTADPGWVTGTSYGILSPLSNGLTMIVDEAEFNAHRWYQILQDEEVTVWYTAPTAVRMLMKAGPDVPRQYDLSRLRFIASVGEPLNPEAVLWADEVLGLPIHDNWWQSETGGIMISNYASMDIKPGSMGRPLPGVEAAVVERTDDGVTVIDEPRREGELALRAGWPSMFRGYLDMEERYRSCFVDGWYLTGDMAQVDDEGYFFFVGRADDLIKSAGHLIGPFEVESTLLEHEAVAQAAVIGKPHPTAGEVVKAFVELHSGFTADKSLLRDLKGFARQRLGPTVAPREIEIIDEIPRTRSGKIMRRLLKARELGEPEGDTSTLEGGPS